MKKRILIAAVMALALLPGAKIVRAEEHEGGHGEWKAKLGLSADQIKQIDALHDSQKAEMKPLADKRHELVEKLDGQIKAKAADADIKATLEDLSANHDSSEAVEEKFHKSMDAILTPTQQAKMIVMRTKHHEEEEKKEKGEEKKEHGE